ncbi:MAG: FeoB-associated Cys-rich membrane protein [Solobacterium sp.]|nr:FeoB-associated Cys-rich membrane protein [Solobacterium sp.]
MPMNTADVILIVILLAIAGFALFLMIRRKKKGSSCCGTCAGCECMCEKRNDAEPKENPPRGDA